MILHFNYVNSFGITQIPIMPIYTFCKVVSCFFVQAVHSNMAAMFNMFKNFENCYLIEIFVFY